MVMGPTHARMGAGAGLTLMATVPAALGHPASIPTQLVGALLCAGAAIVPDLDHPDATAARSLGPVTGLVARLLAGISGWTYRHTRTPYDSDRDGTHRALTHTGIGAVGAGALCAVTCALPGVVGTAAILLWLFLLAVFALRALPPRMGEGADMVQAAALTALAWLLLPDLSNAVWLGACVTVGCLVHDIGDAITYSGVPLFFPRKIRGQRWYPVRPPYGLRIAANGAGDLVVRALSTVGVVVLLINLIPGAWSHIFGGLGWAWSHVAALMPG